MTNEFNNEVNTKDKAEEAAAGTSGDGVRVDDGLGEGVRLASALDADSVLAALLRAEHAGTEAKVRVRDIRTPGDREAVLRACRTRGHERRRARRAEYRAQNPLPPRTETGVHRYSAGALGSRGKLAAKVLVQFVPGEFMAARDVQGMPNSSAKVAIAFMTHEGLLEKEKFGTKSVRYRLTALGEMARAALL